MIIPVILCGGAGTRLWPLSRSSYPKQLLSLSGEYSLLQQTLLRLDSITCRPVVICSHAHRFFVAEQLQAIGYEKVHLLIEPTARNTAAAVAVAAAFIEGQKEYPDDAVMAVLPADHYIGDKTAFNDALQTAALAATDFPIVTLGVVPTEASIAYGYIQTKQTLGDNLLLADGFIEKPSHEVALKLIADNGVFWNSGLFIATVSSLQALIKQYANTIFKHSREAVARACCDLDFVRLDEASYQRLESVSFDVAVMEKLPSIAVVSLDAGWSDLGAWQSIAAINDADEQGNVIHGDVIAEQSKNSYIHSTTRLVATVGVQNLIVIETADAILVADNKYSQEVSHIVTKLKKDQRVEAEQHPRTHRPWGYYEQLDIAERFKVKRIVVKPNHSLSLQSHHHRSEHWVVVRGTALVECDGKQFLLHENQSTYIPQTHKHRLHNRGKIPLELIEIQVGSYLGEDDILRFDDAYGRDTQVITAATHE